ncbi:hypothetical protein L596_015092 [Steinernema carpocapsae]|uniref:UBX domain-containing protein n=1 Tax=Steinernema carpocapsae TaxID=34508 RepID=A0A4U5NDY0_STECR|nr:hypothetical protein L596_015092 [Steinernema carpocapsae]
MAENGRDSPGLLDHRDDLKASFKEICAVESDEIAADFLEDHEWNLEQAIHSYLNEGIMRQNGHSTVRRRFVDTPSTSDDSAGENMSIGRAASLSPASDADLSSASSSEDEEEAIAGGLVHSVVGWFRSIITLPFRLTQLTVLALYDLLSTFVYLFRSPALSVSDPRGDVRTFVDAFNEKYESNANRIDWNLGSYNDVLQESKQALRFVLVYLHSELHQNTDQFVRSKLLADSFRIFVDRNNLLLWGASVKTAEGYKVSMALRNTSFPFLALIGMRDNRMAMLARIEGDYDLEPMLYTMQTAVDDNIGHFNALRESRLQQDINSRLRREQEAEYERALAADRAKEVERKRLESERLEAERREREEQDALLSKKKRLEDMKGRIRENLPEEPTATGTDCYRVNIRFPCGDKLERKFNADDSLELLFNATLCHESCPDDFSLLSSYPRKALHCFPEWYREFGSVDINKSPIATFAEVGFPKATVVLVQDNEA